MGLIDTLRQFFVAEGSRNALSFNDWVSYFSYNGSQYSVVPSQTLGQKQERPSGGFDGYVQGIYKSNGIVFACMSARMLLFSEARFQFRRRERGRPGELFGDKALDLLERPWPGGTTGDLLSRAIQDADLAGNFYAVRRHNTIRRLRPDWVTIVVGSRSEPGDPQWALDAEVAGYLYQRGGGPPRDDAEYLGVREVAHFAPMPDPSFAFRGMSWITPVLSEIMGDAAATTHKLKFFENGATPNMVITVDPKVAPDVYEKFLTKMKANNDGLDNAYKTLYLGGGSTAQVIGKDMKQIDFKVTQGAGETRIAAAAGVPPIIVGLSEGLQAATYSNYGQARRRFADGTMRPLWRNIAGSLAPIIDVPANAELWYDDRDIPFLAEDQKDAAEIQQAQAQTMKSLIDAGFKPESVTAAVISGDFNKLTHTGLFSVQLQPPMPEGPPEPVAPVVPDPEAPVQQASSLLLEALDSRES